MRGTRTAVAAAAAAGNACCAAQPEQLRTYARQRGWRLRIHLARRMEYSGADRQGVATPGGKASIQARTKVQNVAVSNGRGGKGGGGDKPSARPPSDA
eukprot:361666-Chlamydomonas_euryale.AAC.2